MRKGIQLPTLNSRRLPHSPLRSSGLPQARLQTCQPPFMYTFRGPGSMSESRHFRVLGESHGKTLKVVDCSSVCDRCRWDGGSTNVRGKRKAADVFLYWQLGDSPCAVGRDGKEYRHGHKDSG